MAQVAVKPIGDDQFLAWGKRGKLGPHGVVREPGDVWFKVADTAEDAVETVFADLAALC